jgi:hypothetical protein
VRTTTAWRTSPLRTLLAALTDTLLPVSGPKLRCFLTTTTMRSPGYVNSSNHAQTGLTYQLSPGASIAGH